MFVAIVNSKGGVGKSTLTVHAAVWLHERGRRVVVLDADAQASTTHWLARAAPQISIEQYSRSEAILARAAQLTAEADVVLADGPAALGTESAALVKRADLVLLPIGPSMMDVDASYYTARAIYRTRFRGERQGLPLAYTVLNRVQSRTRLARVTAAAVEKYGFPTAATALHLRQAYADACGRGTVVWHMRSAGRTAAEEITRLFCEVFAERDHAPTRSAGGKVITRPATEVVPDPNLDRPVASAGVLTSQPTRSAERSLPKPQTHSPAG